MNVIKGGFKCSYKLFQVIFFSKNLGHYSRLTLKAMMHLLRKHLGNAYMYLMCLPQFGMKFHLARNVTSSVRISTTISMHLAFMNTFLRKSKWCRLYVTHLESGRHSASQITYNWHSLRHEELLVLRQCLWYKI